MHQWGDLTGAAGTLIIFEQGFLDPATSAHLGDPHGAVVRVPAEADQEALRAATIALEQEFRTPGRLPLETHLTILRHLLSAVVLNLAQPGASPGGPAPQATQTFLRFRDAVETRFASTRRLEDYARTLGYSTRTLSRASMDAAGVGAKEYIDRRVLLEAKRLLAHGDQPAAKIASTPRLLQRHELQQVLPPAHGYDPARLPPGCARHGYLAGRPVGTEHRPVFIGRRAKAPVEDGSHRGG